MSVCGQSGHAEDDSVSEEVGPTIRDKPSDIYKQKPASKVVRVLTVLAYLLSVSLAAILLSVYYICVWKSPELSLNDPIGLSARQGNQSEYGEANSTDRTLFVSGGGDTAVNSSITPSLENITSDYQQVYDTDITTETAQDTQQSDTTPQGISHETTDDKNPFNNTDSIT